jgi:hypothetical protein
MNKFLCVGDVPADIVDRCCTKIDDSEHYYSLNRLLAGATQKGNTEDMYEPLVSLAEHKSPPPILIIPPPSPQRNIFDSIERADSDTPRRVRRCTRKIITKSTAPKDEGQGLPNLLPDMSVVDVEPSDALVDCPSIAFRRQALSVIEIDIYSGIAYILALFWS